MTLLSERLTAWRPDAATLLVAGILIFGYGFMTALQNPGIGPKGGGIVIGLWGAGGLLMIAGVAVKAVEKTLRLRGGMDA